MNSSFATWELLLLGALVILVLFWITPGLKQAFKKSEEAENPDWAGALIPLAIVAAFVALLLYIV